MMACFECGAERGHLLGCSRVDARFRNLEPPLAAAVGAAEEEDRDGESVFERHRLWAFPVVYLGAWGLVSTDGGAFLARTFFGMWLHELGHASAAWLCGVWAIPAPWFTWSFGESAAVSVLVFGGAGALVWSGRRLGERRRVVWGATLGAAALGCHLLGPNAQEVFVTFAGEAGAMLYGAALSTAFLLPPRGRALRGGLRWGWLVIGAMAWVDSTQLWLLARRDPANLPFGLENGTESDATKLVDRFHWAEDAMVSRYLVFAALTGGLALAAWLLAFVQVRRPQRQDPPTRVAGI
jgi:hypothetical protein